MVKVQTWHIEKFATFLAKLAGSSDGEGTLLDRSIFMYGSNMSNNDMRNSYPVPVSRLTPIP